MAWLVTSPEDMAVLDEINRGASDRALGIIAASLVEIHLTKLIQTAFIAERGRETVQGDMLRSSGPLGSFSAKINLAYLMGLISEELFQNLHIMREVRNRFAHNTEVSSFAHQEISSRCFNFTLVDKYVVDPDNGLYGDDKALFGYHQPKAAQRLKVAKDRYELSAQIFSMGIQSATVDAKPYTPAF